MPLLPQENRSNLFNSPLETKITAQKIKCLQYMEA